MSSFFTSTSLHSNQYTTNSFLASKTSKYRSQLQNEFEKAINGFDKDSVRRQTSTTQAEFSIPYRSGYNYSSRQPYHYQSSIKLPKSFNRNINQLKSSVYIEPKKESIRAKPTYSSRVESIKISNENIDEEFTQRSSKYSRTRRQVAVEKNQVDIIGKTPQKETKEINEEPSKRNKVVFKPDDKIISIPFDQNSIPEMIAQSPKKSINIESKPKQIAKQVETPKNEKPQENLDRPETSLSIVTSDNLKGRCAQQLESDRKLLDEIQQLINDEEVEDDDIDEEIQESFEGNAKYVGKLLLITSDSSNEKLNTFEGIDIHSSDSLSDKQEFNYVTPKQTKPEKLSIEIPKTNSLPFGVGLQSSSSYDEESPIKKEEIEIDEDDPVSDLISPNVSPTRRLSSDNIDLDDANIVSHSSIIFEAEIEGLERMNAGEFDVDQQDIIFSGEDDLQINDEIIKIDDEEEDIDDDKESKRTILDINEQEKLQKVVFEDSLKKSLFEDQALITFTLADKILSENLDDVLK